jgi:succinate dehydrogenase/fumarate reductase flavoprotein subunit
MQDETFEADIVVIGGGSAGSTAAIRAKELLPKGKVLLLEKAHIKRSGAIAIGMDGLNNAVIPGHATPEQYVKEITMANDGIVDQAGVLAYAKNSFAMIQQLDSWGVKFQKTETGDFDVKKVHHNGSYVLPMPGAMISRRSWPGASSARWCMSAIASWPPASWCKMAASSAFWAWIRGKGTCTSFAARP